MNREERQARQMETDYQDRAAIAKHVSAPFSFFSDLTEEERLLLARQEEEGRYYVPRKSKPRQRLRNTGCM